MQFAIGDINEAIADLVPEREAIVSDHARLTWQDLRLRSRRLGNLIHSAGLGCQRERTELQPWESGQDHVALYLYNGHEYLESMIGAYKARAVPFNVNYRYVEDELLYLFRDSAAKAVIYHASFAPRLAKVLSRLPPMRLLLQVDDGSGEPLLPGALDYEAALADASDERVPVQASGDDLYIVYTGGTTGMPKGVLWRQHDIFYGAMGGRVPGSPAVTDLDDLLSRVPFGEMMRMLPSPPFMHGAGHWTAFINLHAGGTVVLPSNTRKLDPHDIWTTVEKERVLSVSIVGDAFARPLIDQLRTRSYDLSNLRVVGSGGAVLSPGNKRELIDLLPGIMIFDGFGASETGAQGATVTSAGADVPPAFRMDEHTCVLDEDLNGPLPPGSREMGWLARSGHVPLGYLNDEAKTRRTYPTIDGVRYAIPGDRATVEQDGSIRVLGRDSVCINTGGEKVFAEEVETALKKHPSVYDAVVTGTPNPRWGQQITAVVALRPGATTSADELREAAATELARYKLPRDIVFVETVVRAPSGKPDYRWARDTAVERLATGGGAQAG